MNVSLFCAIKGTLGAYIMLCLSAKRTEQQTSFTKEENKMSRGQTDKSEWNTNILMHQETNPIDNTQLQPGRIQFSFFFLLFL